MALIVEFICELPNGVHARPASHVETLCNTCNQVNHLIPTRVLVKGGEITCKILK